MNGRIVRHTCTGFLAMVLVFCLSPAAAEALGFGVINLNSHLNEPLQAEVSMLLSESEQTEQVRVELASESEYRQMGLNRHPDIARVKVTKLSRQADKASIQLYSVGAIHAPILSIVLKATKAGRGTYFRHYRLLFDPVEIVALPNRQSVAIPDATEVAAVPPSPAITGDDWARTLRYGPIHAGESLSRIAQRLRKDLRFSNYQVMLALYDKNRHVFADDNINQLKEGAWLDVPASDVVRSNANGKAMQRLSALLHQPVAGQGPTVQPVADAEQETDQTLQYSGKISLDRASDKSASEAASEATAARDDQFTSIHGELMAGKLQMSDLGKSVAGLNTSVEIIQQDLQVLKQDITAIRNRPQVVAVESTMGWRVAFYMLLAGVAGLLFGMLAMRWRSGGAGAKEKPAPAVAEKKVAQEKVAEPVIVPEEKLAVDDEVIQLINKVEDRLGRCDYEEAGRLLDAVSSRDPGSLRAAALRAQLYHETGRAEACQTLINQISESSDRDGWQRFCQFLPSHVWNACFGDGTVEEPDGKPGKG